MNTLNPHRRSNYRKSCLWTLAIIAAVGLFVSTPQDAQGETITFNDLPAGTVLANQFAASHGVRFSAINHTSWHPDKLVIFDTNNYTGGDIDLAYPWPGGNLQGQQLHKIFVIAENARDYNHDGLIDNPDDEARGGVVTIKFDNLLESFQFDQVDSDDGSGERVKFYKDGALLDTVTYVELAAMDSSIEYGNRKANRLPAVTADMVGDFFDEVRIKVCGSHGFDNITFTPAAVIPEPTTMFLLVGGLVPLIMKRRRNK
ncbi:MAG: PEP-CTERM sorting domain-containing protein [Phycisphaerae bacterium]|jgi:hypothetical protein|nr:PEP-CTERM sorting domain-containing protein [Phycisphaerae bacterium]